MPLEDAKRLAADLFVAASDDPEREIYQYIKQALEARRRKQ
jgi:hypothetical protein